MKKYRAFLLSIILSFSLIVSFQLHAQTWTNPFILSNEWASYGIGDPYILKFNGLYYLYPSTQDQQTGVKCWSSPDLINWTYAGMCSTDAVTKGAYAPEVHYWNGTFYMYTSPAGNGHYVLSSSSPTGPFVNKTGNLGYSIDGTTFVDDDGKMYFFHADNSGILACPMPSPTSIGADYPTNAQMSAAVGNSWTEGPCVFKRNGVYYMTYTGNHVISKGYRIDYATNTTGPLAPFDMANSQNPIIVNSEGNVVGLGHGSVFVGPDLDSYFTTYHNLFGDFGNGPWRHFNYDRIAWNDTKMLVLGPTSTPQQAPRMPDALDRFNRTTLGVTWTIPATGTWTISNSTYLNQSLSTASYAKAVPTTVIGTDFTAEFNVQRIATSNTSALYGAIFGYVDEQNYGLVQLNSATNKIEISIKSANTASTLASVALPSGFNYTVLHTIRIEKQQNTLTVFLDQMNKASVQTTIPVGKIGYFTHLCTANFGFIAFSNLVNGSGIFDVYKPVPGTIAAVHYISGGEGVGYHDLTTGNTGGKYIRNDNVDIRNCTEGGCNIGWNQTGEWYAYNVNVESTDNYILGLRYATNMINTQVRVWQGGQDISGVVTLPNTGGFDNWQTFFIKNLALTGGNQKIKIETVTGEFDFQSMQFAKSDTTTNVLSDSFTGSFSSLWNYDEGTGYIDNGTARVNGYDKMTMGDLDFSNYTVEADIKFNSGMDAGLILRVNNPALGGAGNDPVLGADFFQGYYVNFNGGNIKLNKHNYNYSNLFTSANSYQLNIWYHLKIVANDANIKIYVNDMLNPKINYTDLNPILTGKAGLRVYNCDASFDNFKITTTNSLSTALKDIKQGASNLKLSPNPVHSQLKIAGIDDKTQLTIYDISGVEIMNIPCSNQMAITELDIEGLNQGIYFIKAQSKIGEIKTGRFIKN